MSSASAVPNHFSMILDFLLYSRLHMFVKTEPKKIRSCDSRAAAKQMR